MTAASTARPERPSVSFIVVNWNGGSFLSECLDSIAQEAGSTANVIVVDNASTDDSVAQARRRHPEARYLHNDDNLGFARGTNAGMAASDADLLFLVNVDAYLLPGSLEAMVQYMVSNPPVGIMGPQVLNSDRSLQRTARRRPSLTRSVLRAAAIDRFIPGITFHDHTVTADVDMLTGCFWVVRREALEHVGTLDEQFFMYAEDLDWCRRFSDAGWRVVYYRDAQVVHHGGGTSAHRPVRYFVEMRRSDLQYWRKHESGARATAYGLVLALQQMLRIGASAALALVPALRADARSRIERSGAALRWLLESRLGARARPIGTGERT